MRPLDPAELIDGVHWWELAGHHDPPALLDAWRQVHYACQAVAEAGKSWAEPKADDSHSSLIWVPDTSKLPDQYFAGVLISGAREARALLRPWDMKLFVVDAAGSPLDVIDAEGRTLAEATSWVRDVCESHIGPAKQDANPAPDLPAHPIADGGVFGEPNQLAVAEVIRFYANTDAVLQRLTGLLQVSDHTTDEPKVWPHHFDLATLVTLETDGGGALTKTIGLGITPPDALSDSGYWYVSPWSREAISSAPTLADLPLGAWHRRDGTLPMAMLSVNDVTSTEDPVEQHRRVGSFIAAAYSALSDVIQPR